MDSAFRTSHGHVQWGKLIAEPTANTVGKAEVVRVEAAAISALASLQVSRETGKFVSPVDWRDNKSMPGEGTSLCLARPLAGEIPGAGGPRGSLGVLFQPRLCCLGRMPFPSAPLISSSQNELA